MKASEVQNNTPIDLYFMVIVCKKKEEKEKKENIRKSYRFGSTCQGFYFWVNCPFNS